MRTTLMATRMTMIITMVPGTAMCRRALTVKGAC